MLPTLLSSLALAVPAEFQTTLDEHNLVLDTPAGWEELPGNENVHMSYEHAMRSPNGQLEVRYSVHDMGDIYERMDECDADPDCTGVNDPKALGMGALMATGANVSGGSFTQVIELPVEQVQADYHADYALITRVPAARYWADRPYREVMAMLLHQGDTDVYVFFLFKKWKKVRDEMEEAILALRFGG